MAGGCSAGLDGVGGFVGFPGHFRVDAAAGFRVDLGSKEHRRVFAGGGSVGKCSVYAVVAVHTSGTEVAPVAFQSVEGCFICRLSSLAGAEKGTGWLEGAGVRHFLFLDFLVGRARRFQVMTTLTVVLLEICLDSWFPYKLAGSQVGRLVEIYLIKFVVAKCCCHWNVTCLFFFEVRSESVVD